MSVFSKLKTILVILNNIWKWDRGHWTRLGARVITDINVINSNWQAFNGQSVLQMDVHLIVEIVGCQNFLVGPETRIAGGQVKI